MELQEKIDQYLLDQLSPADKAKFEQLMSGDAHLKSEIAMQKSIVSALGDARSLQLKARMQKIPVSMSSTAHAIRLKWIGAGAAASVVAGLIIFMLSGQETTTTTETTNGDGNAVVSAPIQSTTDVTNTAVPATETVATADVKQPVTVQKNSSSAQVQSSDIKAFDNSASFNESEENGLSTPNQDNNTAPSSNLTTEANNKLANLSVAVDTQNLKDKSYQFSGSKLTLFGDFNSKPYELLELNNKGQKTLFLSYDNEYYELVWGKTTKTPLKKVQHKETLEKLKVINP
jgi:hypothetical protein